MYSEREPQSIAEYIFSMILDLIPYSVSEYDSKTASKVTQKSENTK